MRSAAAAKRHSNHTCRIFRAKIRIRLPYPKISWTKKMIACLKLTLLRSIPIMSRLEELSDGFDESLQLNNSSPAPIHANSSTPNTFPTASPDSTPFPVNTARLEKDGTTPALPPHMASVRTHTADEIVQMMNRTPLFMTSLENTEGEGMSQITHLV